MKAFYSILYCPIRPTVGERISIALLFKGDNGVFFRYSHDKLSIIKGLLPKEAYNLLRANLKNIDAYIMERKDAIIQTNAEESLLSEKYFQYLSNYTNNLLTFSNPTPINLPFTEEVFDKLFKKYVFEIDEERHREEENIVRDVKHRLKPLIKEYVNLDIELTSSSVENLIVPTKVWFIGKNESEVTGEAFAFDKTLHHLKNDLHSYLYLVDRFMENNPQSQGTYFVVGKEPSKSLIENHNLWNEIRGHKHLTYIAPSETARITEYVAEHGVTPFLPISS